MAKRRRRRSRGRSTGPYRMTPKRRAALRKAQLESARKRKGISKKKVAVGITATVGTAAVLGAGIVRHKASGSSLSVSLGRGRPGPSPATLFAEGTPARKAQLHQHHRLVEVRASKKTTPILSGITQYDTGIRHTQVNAMARLKNVVGVSVSYHHKPASGQQVRDFLHGRTIPSGGAPPQAIPTIGVGSRSHGRPRRRIDRDTIPHMNPSAQKSWPHTSVKNARIQNKGLRTGTHYLHPKFGVRRFPDDPRGRKEIEKKIAEWVAGDRGVLPRGWHDTTPQATRRRRKK